MVLGGLAAQNWPAYMESNPYHPKLLFLDVIGARAFVTNKATTDTSLLKGSIAGGPYGPDQAIFEEPQMQACIKTLAAAGVKTPAPEHGRRPTRRTSRTRPRSTSARSST